MNAEKFVTKSLNNIPKKPIERVGDHIKSTIKNDNYIVDSHAHFFDGGCVDVTYFLSRIVSTIPDNLRDLLFRKLLKRKASPMNYSTALKNKQVEVWKDEIFYNASSFQGLTLLDLENVIDSELSKKKLSLQFIDKKFDYVGSLRRIKQVIGILKSNKMKYVLDMFESKHSVQDIYNNRFNTNKDQITIALGMDLNKGWYNSSAKGYQKQNDELGKLGNTRNILPFFPIDPRRADEEEPSENLYEQFYRAFTKPDQRYFGVKVYPALGYLPSDKRLEPIFKVCNKLGIPVLTHCGGTTISTFEKVVWLNRDGVKERLYRPTRKQIAKFLNEPKEWKLVLKRNKDLKLCFGHFGSSEEWKKNNPGNSQRIQTIVSYMKQYKNVYADFSFNLESQKATRNFTKFINDKNNPNHELLTSRSLFGTDYWVVLPQCNIVRDQKYFLKKSGDLAENLLIENPKKYLGI